MHSKSFLVRRSGRMKMLRPTWSANHFIDEHHSTSGWTMSGQKCSSPMIRSRKTIAVKCTCCLQKRNQPDRAAHASCNIEQKKKKKKISSNFCCKVIIEFWFVLVAVEQSKIMVACWSALKNGLVGSMGQVHSVALFAFAPSSFCKLVNEITRRGWGHVEWKRKRSQPKWENEI